MHISEFRACPTLINHAIKVYDVKEGPLGLITQYLCGPTFLMCVSTRTTRLTFIYENLIFEKSWSFYLF